MWLHHVASIFAGGNKGNKGNHGCQLNRRIQGPLINRMYTFADCATVFGIVIHALLYITMSMFCWWSSPLCVFSISYYHHTSSSSFSRFTSICIIMCVLCLFFFLFTYTYIIFIYMYRYLQGGYDIILSGMLWFRPSNL